MSDLDLDFGRLKRSGMHEAIYGHGKTLEQLRSALEQFQAARVPALVTRLEAGLAGPLLEAFPEASYCQKGRTLSLGEPPQRADRARVALVCAGTTDIPVLEEAAAALRLSGVEVERFQDCGVAGIHRLFAHLEAIRQCSIVIAFAGFEGALPSVLGGLLHQLVIGVPTSTGYGAARSGETALMAMLSACASGLVVVNIDNGYGAAMAALRHLNSKPLCEL
jgi:NCAIR mutase (PurE)-related protein